MNLVDILYLGAAALGGGGVTAVANAWLGKAKVNVEKEHGDLGIFIKSFELALNAVTKQRDDAIGLVEDLRKRVDNLELELMGVKLSSGFDPFPRWLVDLHGRYIFVNSCFAATFLEPLGRRANDIIGEGHDFIWPPDTCAKLEELERRASSRPDGRARIVMVANGVEMSFYSFPVRNGGIVVAHAGYACPHD